MDPTASTGFQIFGSVVGLIHIVIDIPPRLATGMLGYFSMLYCECLIIVIFSRLLCP